MTREEYYRILKEKHDATNWENINEVRKYNEFARELRKILEEDESEN